MRRKSDPLLNERVETVLSDPRVAQGLTDYSLTIDGQPIKPREIRYRAEDVRASDAPTMVLEATLPGFYPPEYEGKEATVDLSIDGISFREFTGAVRVIEPTDDGDTQIEAFTSGEWLSAQEIGAKTSWSGVGARTAAYRVITGGKTPVPYSRIDLEGVPEEAKLYRLDADSHPAESMKAELLSDIRGQSGAILFDDADNALKGTTLFLLGSPGEPVARYQGGVHFRTFRPTPSYEGRYSEVVVFRAGDGEREVLQTLPVDNRGVYVPDGVSYPVEVTDPSAEAVSAALSTGLVVANALSYGAWSGELTLLVCDPRLERVDTVAISETRLEDSPVTREWLLVISGYAKDPKQKTTTLVGTVLKTAERKA